MSGFTLGMPTLIELDGLEANVALASRLGLSFVELNMNEPRYCPEALSALCLLAVRGQSGVDFTLHLPEELDLASFHPSIRRGHLDRCLEAIAWAGEAGMRLVNLHLNPGVYFTLPERRVWLYEKYRDRFLATLEGSFRAMLDRAGPADVTICIENAGGEFAEPFIREALERLLRLDPHRIGLTWDVGHDAGSGCKARPVFEDHPERVRHMHLHDYDGKESHRVLFSGSVDVAAALSFAKHRGIDVVLETKTVGGLAESVKRIDQRDLH